MSSRIGALSFLGVFALASTIRAAEPDAAEPAAEQAAAIVADALQAEAEGNFLIRQRLLVEAEQMLDDFAPAKWQRGWLRQADGKWADIASSVEASDGDELLEQYEQRRGSLPDNLASHWAIAKWCSEQGLADQCRSHLNRVLVFEPDNAAARAALGFRSVGGEWISPDEMARMASRTQTAVESVSQYGRQLRSIARRLMSGDTQARASAREELFSIDDPLAIPAVESALATTALGPSKVVIEWLANVDVVESSKVLARYSLFHPAAEVREHGISYLVQRPCHDFVPDMLRMMTTPVNTMIVPTFDRRGTLTGYRQAFSQETFDKRDFVVLDRAFERQRVALTADVTPAQARQTVIIGEQAANRAVQGMAQNEVALREVDRVRENAAREQRNARIGEVISSVANREFSSDAKEMWEWWDDYSETEYQAYKPERYRRTRLVSRVPQYELQGAQQAHECFVAGTQVMTRRGLRSIEQVVVGDTVLSRNVLTGELGWKPVLRSTTRPPEKTFAVSVGSEQLRCTGGHLFWVSGKGWKKASELQSGDILHAAEEPTVVTKVSEMAMTPTFNLEVADNATYFVGKSMVMTHDVTAREPNRQPVPGHQLVSMSK